MQVNEVQINEYFWFQVNPNQVKTKMEYIINPPISWNTQMSEFWFSVIPYQGPTAFLTNLTRFSGNHNEPESLIERGRGDFALCLLRNLKWKLMNQVRSSIFRMQVLGYNINKFSRGKQLLFTKGSMESAISQIK